MMNEDNKNDNPNIDEEPDSFEEDELIDIKEESIEVEEYSIDDLEIQKKLDELEDELINEAENEQQHMQSIGGESPIQSYETKLSNDDEGFSLEEIDEKLDEVESSGIDHRQRQNMQPTGVDNIAAESLALVDDIEDNEDNDCLNCSAPLKGPYCHNCGQPDRHFIRFFPKVLWDMINEAFDFDSRIFRTLVPLLLYPGRLSMEYIAGRRARYVNPLRLYIILSVIFFISISLFNETTNDFQIDSSDGVNVRVRTTEDGTEIKETETIEKKSIGIIKEDGTSAIELDNDKPWNVESNPILFYGSFNNETTKELNIFLWSLSEKLDKAIKDDPSELMDEFLNAIPQLMFILLPLFALLLKLTYIFKKRYYMEHLIVALHSHCFIFFSLLLIMLFNEMDDVLVEPSYLKSGLNFLTIALLIWLPLNIYITQKRIYAQGYILTTLKYIFVGVAYWWLLLLTASMAFVVGLVKM